MLPQPPAGVSSVPAAFGEQARRRPGATALLSADRAVSYAALDAQSSRLACRLIAHGVRPGEPVAICSERTVEQLAALLAILKAGGAYLPLDPAWPDERLRFMLDDAEVRVLVIARGRRALGQGLAHVLELEDPELFSGGAEPPPRVEIPSEQLAYISYTSGSTGTPKGVAVPHRCILRRVLDVGYVRLDETRRVLHAAPAAFDATTFEVWGPLLNGGCCVLLPERVPTAATLREVVRRHGVTTAFLTTALLNALVDDDPAALEGLQQLLFGGELVSVGHVRRLQAACPRTELIHVYGPTEATTFATAFPIRGPIEEGQRTIPIGRPIEHTTVRLLDAEGREAARGAIGEAFIGGAGLALGYLRRPELTAARFVPDGADGARMYRTGDLMLRDAAGDLEFVGRLDDQVKIRGHRIELGEIESRLVEDPEVAAAVVACREDRPGDKRLVAYLVPRAPGRLALERVRQRLRATLPAAMVPAHWCVLDRLPLNPNGKIDRTALPAPAPDAPEGRDGHVPPASEVERSVAGLWSELLRVADPGIEDDFLDAGGDSLLALRLLARVRQRFGVELSIVAFFREPTIAAVAARVEALLYLREGASRAAGDGEQETMWI